MVKQLIPIKKRNMNYRMNFILKLIKKTGTRFSIFIIAFVFGFTTVSFGQEKSNREVLEVFRSLDSNEIAKYSKYDFKGNFAELLVSDKTSDYYYLDLSKFSSSFEFKYFLFLANQSGYQIQSGHGLSESKGWCIDNKKRVVVEALSQILKIKEKAGFMDKALTSIEKKDWIKSQKY